MNSITTIGVCFCVFMKDTVTGAEHACSIHDLESEANDRAKARNVVGLADTEFFVGRITYTEDPSMPLLGESEELDPEYEMSEADIPMSDEDWNEFISDNDYPEVPA